MRVLLILALVLVGVTTHARNDAVLIGADEYEVYAAVIEQVFWKADTRIALIDGTAHQLTAQMGSEAWPYNLLSNRKELQGATVTSQRVKPEAAIRYLLPLERNYSIVDGATVGFGETVGGRPDYSDSTGVLYFSRIGFNADATQALVYVRQHCGGLCGVELWLVLSRRPGGQWRVSSRLTTGVS